MSNDHNRAEIDWKTITTYSNVVVGRLFRWIKTRTSLVWSQTEFQPRHVNGWASQDENSRQKPRSNDACNATPALQSTMEDEVHEKKYCNTGRWSQTASYSQLLCQRIVRHGTMQVHILFIRGIAHFLYSRADVQVSYGIGCNGFMWFSSCCWNEKVCGDLDLLKIEVLILPALCLSTFSTSKHGGLLNG